MFPNINLYVQFLLVIFNKRTEVLYHPPPYIRLDFLRAQIFKKSICGGHFKFQ